MTEKVGLGVASGVVMVPYLELSRAMLRAHHNALAMMDANRTLAADLRGILRRPQDLAVELADAALRPDDAAAREAVFARAAEAVRELGEAVIQAQLNALETLRQESSEAARTAETGVSTGAPTR